jgi:ubiquinol-cytochrome c reductase cytochrome b subunit
LAVYLMIFAFLFTGRLLPWDQNGYWGTRAALEMIERLPFVGPFLQQALQRGDEIGAYTLSSFFALHTFFLPVVLLALVVLHLVLLRYHGIADHPDPSQRQESKFPFYPQQAFRNAMVAFLVLWFLLTLSLVAPAVLEQPADPTDATYDARPEWYFLAHYELLRLFEGLEIIPIFVIPMLLIGAALLLPWIDRSEHRTWRKRKTIVAGALLVFGLLYGASGYSRTYHPGSAGSFAIGALPLPEQGVPDQMLRAREVLVGQRCVNCHRFQGYGGLQGPDLSQAGSKLNRQRLRTHILDPKSLEPDSQMPAYRGRVSEEDLETIVEYLSRMR